MQATADVRHPRTPLSAIVVNVALIHAAVLVLVNQPWAQAKPQPSHPSIASVMQVRTLAQAMSRPAASPSPAQPDALAGAGPVPVPVPVPVTALVPGSGPALAPVPVSHSSVAAAPPMPPKEAPTSKTDASSASDPAAALPPAAATDDSYLPRPLLTVTPVPSDPVIVPFPRQVARPGRYTATLALFIDENGVVRRVRLEGPAAPQPMQDAARDTFLQARFSPGELEGQRVKSLIRVEVVFDNSPLGGSTETRSL